MKDLVIKLVFAWLVGWMVAVGGIVNSGSYGSFAGSQSEAQTKAVVTALVAWPYYVGKHMSVR